MKEEAEELLPAPAQVQRASPADERAAIDTEHDLHRLEQQHYRCKTENEKLAKLCAEQKHELAQFQSQQVAQAKLSGEEQRTASAAKVAAEEVVASKEAMEGEVTQLRKVLDEKGVAIQARDRELEEFTARIVRTNALKAQAQDDHHDATMQLQRARRETSVANEEAELARQQARSSDSEVQRLNEELLRLRKEKSARERDMQGELDKARAGQDHPKPRASGSTELSIVGGAAVERLRARVKELEADATKAQADAEEQLWNQQKLTQLYKESQEDGDLKASELQVMLAAKSDECERLKREHSEAHAASVGQIEQLEEQARSASLEIEALKQQVEEVKEFGDGAFSPPATDGSGKRRRRDVSSLSESAALAQRYAGVSSTVLASRYEKSQAELRKAKEEQKKLQGSMDEVLLELERRAPTVAKVFEEQERMSKKYSELSAKMSEEARQNGDLRKEVREAGKFRADAQQHREVLEREVVVLRKQVGQLMSTPVTQPGSKRRRGTRPQLTDRPAYRAPGSTLALTAPAAAGASNALVLQDVEGSELNMKQDLERKVIELQVQCETLQEASKTSVLQAKLKDCVDELDEVRGQRHQMEEVIKSITRQRDSYMETLKSEIEGNAAAAKVPKPQSPRKLLPPPSAETQCMQALTGLQAEYAKNRTEWTTRITELQGRVEGLTKRASSAEIAYARQQAELEHAKQMASDYESQEQDVAQRVHLAEARTTESEGLLRDLRTKFDAADAERSLAQAELARVKSGLESAERRYEATKLREAALQKEYEELAKSKNTQAVALADALEAKQRDSQAHTGAVSGLQAKVSVVEEEKTVLEAKLSRQQDANEASRAALSSVTRARDSAEELVLSLRSSQEGLRQQCAQLTARLNEASAAAATAAAAQRAQRAQGGNKTLLSTQVAADNDAANLQAELASASDQIASLKQHITDYKQLVQHSEAQVQELRKAAQDQTTSQASASQQLTAAGQRTRSLAKELEEAKAQVTSSATALQAKEAEMAAAEAAQAAATRRAGQLQAQLATKTTELAQITAARTALIKSSEASKAEMGRLQALANQVEAARAEAAAAQGALGRTEAKGHEALKEMQKTIDTTTAEMRDARTQNEMLLGQLDRAMNSVATDSGDAGVDSDAVEGLREVVKSLRRGREMAEARLELSQQQALRNKSQVEVLTRELAALRSQGNSLTSPVPSSPAGAALTEKDRAKLVGNMAAAQQSSAMVEELRASRNKLGTQLQAATQAKNAAVSAKATADKAKEYAELAASRLQATLSVKETEAKMWQTKLENSTARVRFASPTS